jgi:hypothetical protein
MEERAQLSLQRTSQWVGRLRAYDVYVDGRKQEAGIANGETRTYSVAPGTHAVYVKSSWYRSDSLRVTAQSGQTVYLECGSPIRGWKVLLSLYYLFFPREWFYVRERR